MLDRRALRPFTVACAAALLMSPCVAATADTPNPTNQQLRAAHQKVTAAKRSVETLQARAEVAAEQYLGALNSAQKAAVAAQTAKVHATLVASAYDQATAVAKSAGNTAATATSAASAALSAQAQAQADVGGAQQTLNRIAAGSFQSGGQLGMLSALLVASDPLELANGRKLMNAVGSYQNNVVVQLQTSRAVATRAAQQATSLQTVAVTAAQQASSALLAAATAKAVAQSARADASASATTAHLRLVQAGTLKNTAQRLVSEAESSLGSAVRSAASLDADAAAARAAASTVVSGPPPSDAAGIAIHWAFQEIGVPYSWGGGDDNGPTRGFAQGANTVGFDCSGLTLFIYHKAGIQLDHYTGSQYDQGKRITSRADLQPGDLMFFAYDTSNASTIHHVAIFIGNGKMIEAPQTGDVVKVSSSERDDFIGATRPWQG